MGKINGGLWVKFLKGSAAVAIAGAMAFSPYIPDELEAGELGEIRVQSNSSEERRRELHDSGFTVIVVDGNGRETVWTPSNIQQSPQTPVPSASPQPNAATERDIRHITQIPGMGAERNTTPTDGSFRTAVAAIVRAHRTNQYMGTIGIGGHPEMTPQRQAASNNVLAGIHQAFSQDPFFDRFGLSGQGRQEFFDSLTFRWGTQNSAGNNALGTFSDHSRTIAVMINQMLANGTIVEGRTDEDLVDTIIWELCRAMGYDFIVNQMTIEDAGSVRQVGHAGLQWDTTVLRAIGEAQEIYDALDTGGLQGLNELSARNLPLANPRFTFDWNQWQDVVTLDTAIRDRGSNANSTGNQVLNAVALAMGQSANAALNDVHRLQTNVHGALNQDLTAEQRANYGALVNDMVLTMSLVRQQFPTLTQAGTVKEHNRPMMNANNLNEGLLSPSLLIREATAAATAPLSVSTENAAPETAVPSSHSVFVDGVSVPFRAFNIDGSNFFMLRDIAYVLNNTPSQFDVTWDGERNAINLLTGQSYTVAGGEMASGDGAATTASVSTTTVYIDGSRAVLGAYNIGGNNFFMLRDLGEVLNFGVDWDETRNAVMINPASSP